LDKSRTEHLHELVNQLIVTTTKVDPCDELKLVRPDFSAGYEKVSLKTIRRIWSQLSLVHLRLIRDIVLFRLGHSRAIDIVPLNEYLASKRTKWSFLP
jgi:hypothetical protein